MVQLVPSTELYKDVVGDSPVIDSMTSTFPTYSEWINGFRSEANFYLANKTDLINAQQLKDLRKGSQYLWQGMALYQPGAVTGLPMTMLSGFKALLQSETIGDRVSDSAVIQDVMNADNPRDIAGAVIGAALAGLGLAAPVVGIIAGAVVALATGIYRAMEKSTQIEDKNAEAFKALQYQYFPDLQQADSDTDAYLVNNLIRPAITSSNWTALFAPRWKGTSWVGMERKGGFAFAMGKSNGSIKFDGSVGEKFLPTGGLGCIPGTSAITDIIQVNLPHDPADRNTVAAPFYNFLRGGLDPRAQSLDGVQGKVRVFDTGSFYPTSGRLAGMMWDWASRPHNPMKFRIDTKRLADGDTNTGALGWRRYCEAGLEYIRKVCYPWTSQNLLNTDYNFGGEKDPQFYAYDPNANFEGYFGTAIFHAIGTFTASRVGLINKPPTYKGHPPPFGILGSECGTTKVYGQQHTGIWSGNSGPFLPITDPTQWPDQFMGTRYDRGPLPIGSALAEMKRRQLWDLKHSPVSVATCHELDAAFVNSASLLDQLRKSRAILLSHEARFSLSLDDVSPDEPALPGIPGASWRDQLQAVGVKPGIKLQAPVSRASLGDKEPVPEDIPFDPIQADPWDPTPPERKGRDDSKRGGGAIMALGVGALATIAGVAGYALWKGHPVRRR